MSAVGERLVGKIRFILPRMVRSVSGCGIGESYMWRGGWVRWVGHLLGGVGWFDGSYVTFLNYLGQTP